MALTITTGAPTIKSTANASTYAFTAFVPATSALLVVIAAVRASVGVMSILNTSGTSLTWTRATSAVWNTNDTISLHWAKTPGSTASSVYTVDCGGDAGTACGAYMWSIVGHNANVLSPIHQFASGANAASTNPTVTFPQAVNTLNGGVALWAGGLSSTDPANVSAVPGSWVEDNDAGIATPTTNFSSAHINSGETAQTITFTAGSTSWGMLAAEIYAAGQAGAMPVFQTNRWKRHIRTTRNIIT